MIKTRLIGLALAVLAVLTLITAPSAAGSWSWLSGHVQNIGNVSQQRLPDGRVMVGTTGRGLRLEQVTLKPISPLYDAWCQANLAGTGWQEPVKNGSCGTTGQSRAMLTLRVWVRPADGTPTTEPTITPTTSPSDAHTG